MTNTEDDRLPESFTSALDAVPHLPDQIYAGIHKRIVRRRIIARTVWLAAASLVIFVSGVSVHHRITAPVAAVTPEVAEELTSISTYCNTEEAASYTDSYYETVLNQQ